MNLHTFNVSKVGVRDQKCLVATEALLFASAVCVVGQAHVNACTPVTVYGDARGCGDLGGRTICRNAQLRQRKGAQCQWEKKSVKQAQAPKHLKALIVPM